MKKSIYRAIRCEHGMLDQLCVVRGCRHWSKRLIGDACEIYRLEKCRYCGGRYPKGSHYGCEKSEMTKLRYIAAMEEERTGVQ